MSTNTKPFAFQKNIKILIGVFVLLLAWPFLRSLSTNNDLNIFFGAAERLTRLENPYTTPYNAQGWALDYYYSPLFASLLSPFTWLPKFIVSEEIPFGLFVLKLLWNALNLYFVYQLVQFANRVFAPRRDKKGFIFWLCFALLTYRWVFLNLLYGQMTILIVWGVVKAFEGTISGSIKKNLGLAFGVTLKILPVYMVGQLFLMRKWKAFTAAVLLSVAMVILPYAYLPATYHTEILVSWMNNINPFSKNHIVELGEGGFIDMGALITKYLTGLNIEGEARVDWFSMGATGVFITTQLFRLLVLASCWYWLERFRKLAQPRWELLSMSVFLACIPLAFPHQRDYSLFMVWPLLLFVLNDVIYAPAIRRTFTFYGLMIGATLMGSIVFFEALPFDIRRDISGYRIQGIGGLIFLIFAQGYLWNKLKGINQEKFT